MTTLMSKQNGARQVRTFVAVELSQDVRTALVSLQGDLHEHESVLKFVSPQLMHITVRFLGDIPRESIPALSTTVEESISNVSAFALRLSSVGTFPSNSKQPRVVWVGLVRDSGYGALWHVNALVEYALRGLGFVAESRKFEPHLTIARVRRDSPQPALLKLAADVEVLHRTALSRDTFQVDHLTLMRSDLSPSGPSYAPLATFHFLKESAGDTS
ncbi:MAG: RNA 2',3'-cyclic phosphodiesterase [Chloroflexota bacterium]